MKKILVAISNFGTEQLTHLEKVVEELKNFKKYKVTIIVNSDIPLNIKGIDLVNIIKLDNCLNLPLTCRQVLLTNKDDFDLFIFNENDHLFQEHHIDNYFKYVDILPSTAISGLLRYEKNEHTTSYPDYHAHYTWDYNSVVQYGGKVFAHFTNLHQGCFMLTKSQINEISSKHDFTLFFGSSTYGPRERTNTDIYQLYGKNKLICISDFKENIIHHLPNTYITPNNGRVSFGTVEERMIKNINQILKK